MVTMAALDTYVDYVADMAAWVRDVLQAPAWCFDGDVWPAPALRADARQWAAVVERLAARGLLVVGSGQHGPIWVTW